MSGVCSRRAALGERCEPFNDSCVDPASYCYPDSMTCRPRLAEGAPCRDAADRCATGLFCLGPAADLRCRALAKIGDACSSGERACVPDAHCSRDSRCTQDPLEGQPCSCPESGVPMEPDAICCSDGLDCKAGRCVRRLLDDEPCERSDQCESGSCAGGRCARLCW